jgi:hypothetical protein
MVGTVTGTMIITPITITGIISTVIIHPAGIQMITILTGDPLPQVQELHQTYLLLQGEYPDLQTHPHPL